MAVMMIGALMAPGTVSAAQDPGDAPEHGVARISLLSGDVAVRRGDSGELVDAELNAPLVSQDHVITEGRSRVEIQFDWANLLRVAPDSEVRLAELQDGDFLVQVVAGTVTVRVLRGSTSNIEISTPMVSLVPRDEGSYRITVRDDFSTELTVRAGEAQIYIENTSDFLRAGQTLLVDGDPSNPRRAYRAAIALDDWDRFNEDRDRDLARSDSYKYLSRNIYGAEDLSGHGRWVYDAPYGWVWAPNVYVGWAPYREGRWTWLDYYGWTWVSADPWGWAPYHYGRWYYGPRYGWTWYPGAVTVRYTWRPALVEFFGWGTNVGWVPLAPYEVYRPWYGSGRTVVNNVTVVNEIDVINRYHNARFVSGRSGVTSVTYNDFGRHRTTVNNYVVGSERDFWRASSADRLHERRPERDNREFVDRRRPERINASARASTEPIERVRRTEARRREVVTAERTQISGGRPSDSSRTRNESVDTRVLRSSDANDRRSDARGDDRVADPPQVSRGRPSENNRPRNESNDRRGQRPAGETFRRAEPQRTEPVAVDRNPPSNNRGFANRNRNEENVRREDPPQAAPSQQTENPRRMEAPRNEPGRPGCGNSENARREDSSPQTSSPGVRNRPQDNERPRSGNSENARREDSSPQTSSPGVRNRPQDTERPRSGNSENARREDSSPQTSSPGVRNRPPDDDRPPTRSAAPPAPSQETPAPAPAPEQGNSGRGRGGGRR